MNNMRVQIGGLPHTYITLHLHAKSTQNSRSEGSTRAIAGGEGEGVSSSSDCRNFCGSMRSAGDE
jgi:hypothetical protein